MRVFEKLARGWGHCALDLGVWTPSGIRVILPTGFSYFTELSSDSNGFSYKLSPQFMRHNWKYWKKQTKPKFIESKDTITQEDNMYKRQERENKTTWKQFSLCRTEFNNIKYNQEPNRRRPCIYKPGNENTCPQILGTQDMILWGRGCWSTKVSLVISHQVLALGIS